MQYLGCPSRSLINNFCSVSLESTHIAEYYSLLVIDRSAYCDAQLPPENLKDFLPQLIPVWLKLKFSSSTLVPTSAESENLISDLCTTFVGFAIQHGLC